MGARRSSTRCGEITCSSRTALSTCTSGACARRSLRAATRASSRPYAARDTGSSPRARLGAMPESRIASRLLLSVLALALAAGASVAIGVMTEPEWGWASFALMLLVALLHHLRQLLLLVRCLEQGEALEGHRSAGVWDELHALLHRSRREAAKREADLADQVARWRAAA